MSQTVLITGCSSGIGLAAAKLFQSKGWDVVATMRDPEVAEELSHLKNVTVLKLDVTDPDSIKAAVDETITTHGGIDVLVNNAGYGAYGPLEATPREKVIRQFDTNVIGLIDVTKAVLPHFRRRKAGVIVNVSSLGGRVAWPLGSLYHATKFAIEGLSESLRFELSAIGVRIKLVEPGRVATDFNGRSIDVSVDPAMSEYQPVIEALIAGSSGDTYRTEAGVPAQVIFDAATDGSDKFRYLSGHDAIEGMENRSRMNDEELYKAVRQSFGLA